MPEEVNQKTCGQCAELEHHEFEGYHSCRYGGETFLDCEACKQFREKPTLNPDTNFRVISKRSPETGARKAEMPAGDRRKIYLASSWRNAWQSAAVKGLRAAGHEVYDFQNPAPGSKGFAWSEIDPDWQQWNPTRFVSALEDPIALSGYRFDKAALDWCDTCVLLLPCGRSAHLEAGYAIGQGKPTLVVLAEDRFEPELMYLLADVVVSDLGQMIPALEGLPRWNHRTPEPGTSVVSWVRYDGTPETLPKEGKPVRLAR